ncbi:Uncharacterised protein [uncultured archaeon]|nr:Uncharacterised protein [uncultured archaeon]
MRALKGQVAAEYLAMYGWALLAMFAVVAILLGSGMLSAGRFTSEECTFAPNLPCNTGYFMPPTSGNAQSMNLFVNITNTQGFPMIITNCSFRLVGGDPAGVVYLDTLAPECYRQVPQGAWFNHPVELTSNQRLAPGDMRRAYITYTFKNCQDLAWDDCYSSPEREAHVTSGRLVAGIRIRG